MASNELDLYTSFEEEKEKKCIICCTAENKPSESGKKITIDEITVHHFCLVSFVCTIALTFRAFIVCDCDFFLDFVGKFEAVDG